MTDTATIKGGSVVRGIARIPLWVLALAFVVGYIAIVTDDAYVVRVPLKLYFVAGAFAVWWLQVGRHRRLADYRFGMPVLVYAVGIAVIWSLLAAAHAHGGDLVGLHRVTWTLQEGSRFVYLLLYFPLVDARRRYGKGGIDLWLFPVLALCVITVALFVSHYVLGRPDDTAEFLFFGGVFEGNPGGFRVFIGNQVLFVAALALLLAELAVHGRSRFRLGAIGLLIVSAYLSHTRGIWLGLSVVAAGVVVVLFLRDMSEPARRRLLAAVAAAAVLVAIFSIGYLAGALPRPSFLLDASASSRVSQAPKLWDAFKSNPILGDGFGAVIRPKFIRDPAAPWSYELTYLQILFQTGVVGLIAILSLPLAAAWRGLRSSLAPRLDAEELAGGMAIGGVLLASATKP